MAEPTPPTPAKSPATDDSSTRARLERIARDAPPPPADAADASTASPSAASARSLPDAGMPISGDSGSFITLICALIFLYVGYSRLGSYALRGSAVYGASVKAFPWLCIVSGGLLVLAAGLVFLRLRVGLLVEFLAGALATAMCLIIGAIWFFDGDSEGLLLLIFAVVNGHAARSAYLDWRRT